jgi:hypothetical protein
MMTETRMSAGATITEQTPSMIPSARAVDGRARGWRHVVAAAVLTAVCFAPAVRTARGSLKGVSEPFDLDQFRDAAAAQASIDGHWLSDPFYRGETIWYTPLLSWTIAVVSRARHTAAAVTLVQAGPYLNALAPIGLFVLVTTLFGPWPACVAVVSLLYAPAQNDPPWASPSYSPWLFGSNFASGLFYLALAVHARGLRRPRAGWWIASGVALGLVFLAHAAPALILGLVFTANLLVWQSQDSPRRRSPIAVLAIVFGTAALVSAPLLWSIVGRYHLHVFNRAPAGWVWSAIASPWLVLDRSLNVRTALAVTGVVLLIRRVRDSAEARIVLGWCAAATILFGYGYIQRAVAPALPAAFVPDFHFYFYLRAAGCVLTGLAVWEMATRVGAAAARSRGASIGSVAAFTAAILAIPVAVFAWSALDRYRDGVAFGEDNAAARRATYAQFDSRLTTRLRDETPADAVVLASPMNSLVGVGPAGRAVVAVPPEFSNPYVPFEPRARDQQQLFAVLMAGKPEAFVEAAAARGVTHVLLGPQELAAFDALGPFEPLREVSRTGGFAIFAVRRPADRNER